jgi:hypothetical protein
MRVLPVTPLMLLCIACGPRYSSAALGQYPEFQPFMTRPPPASTRIEPTYDVELTRQAFVSLIAITPPAGGYEDRPVVFTALYPLYDTDRLMFPPGEHRLRSRRSILMEPRNCADDEKPALDGCRRSLRLLPGLLQGRPPGAPTHYLLITADEFVDPFELADELYFRALTDDALRTALLEGDTDGAAALIERALLDRRGTPLWAALYVVTR